MPSRVSGRRTVSWACATFWAATACRRDAPAAADQPTPAVHGEVDPKPSAAPETSPPRALWFADAGSRGVPANWIDGDDKLSAVLAGQRVTALTVGWRWATRPAYPSTPISKIYTCHFDWSLGDRNALEVALRNAGYELAPDLGGKQHTRDRSWVLLSDAVDVLTIAYSYPESDSQLPAALASMPVPHALAKLGSYEGGQLRNLRYSWIRDTPDIHEIGLEGYIPSDVAALDGLIRELGGTEEALDDDPESKEYLWTRDGWTIHATVTPDSFELEERDKTSVLKVTLIQPPMGE
jgi:hypothetical protein